MRHGSATTEKALQAAIRVEAIVGEVLNGRKRALGKMDMEDLALLVQHVRNVSAQSDAGPGLEHVLRTLAEGYRKGVDDACAVLDAEYERRRLDVNQHDRYTEGALDALDEAEGVVRALAPCEVLAAEMTDG